MTDGVVPEWTRVEADGREAVLLNIYEQPDGNAVAIAAAVRQKLDAFRPQLPPNVAMAIGTTRACWSRSRRRACAMRS